MQATSITSTEYKVQFCSAVFNNMNFLLEQMRGWWAIGAYYTRIRLKAHDMSSLSKAKLNDSVRRGKKYMLPTYKSRLKVRVFINIRRAGLWKNQRRVENLAMFKTESKGLTTVFQRLHEWCGSCHGRRAAPCDPGDSFYLRTFQSTFPDSIPGAWQGSWEV